MLRCSAKCLDHRDFHHLNFCHIVLIVFPAIFIHGRKEKSPYICMCISITCCIYNIDHNDSNGHVTCVACRRKLQHSTRAARLSRDLFYVHDRQDCNMPTQPPMHGFVWDAYRTDRSRLHHIWRDIYDVSVCTVACMLLRSSRITFPTTPVQRCPKLVLPIVLAVQLYWSFLALLLQGWVHVHEANPDQQ